MKPRIIDWDAAKEQDYWNNLAWIDWSQDKQQQLLDELRAAVPMEAVGDLFDARMIHVTPGAPILVGKPALTFAAEVLLDGLLEAGALGSVPSDSDIWTTTRQEAEESLQAALRSAEAGKLDLSYHTEGVRSCFAGIDISTQRMIGECHDDDERHWVRELIASIAVQAYYAGRHTQAAHMKPFETPTQKGLDNAARMKGFRDAGNIKKKKWVGERRLIISGLLAKTGRKGVKLEEWVQARLLELGFDNSLRTIRDDIKKIRGS